MKALYFRVVNKGPVSICSRINKYCFYFPEEGSVVCRSNGDYSLNDRELVAYAEDLAVGRMPQVGYLKFVEVREVEAGDLLDEVKNKQALDERLDKMFDRLVK
ncbi:hypothetical protein KY330_04110 [Candidatus Woesearchaeota archaeon]|nr:hypothetical protein [Candidatus Woesearchaeota archaeon]